MLAAEQLTVTAETGSQGQFAKDAPVDCTVSVHLLLSKTERALQVSVAAALPATTGAVPGLLVVVNVMVAGLALKVKLLPANGRALVAIGLLPTGERTVPGALTVQLYVKASPLVGGVATDGPPAGPKSVVTFVVRVPVPVVFVVRMKYVRLVVPVNGLPKDVLAVVRLVVPVFTVSAASGPTETESVVVPVWACMMPAMVSSTQAMTV
jgi:hypothetical protein